MEWQGVCINSTGLNWDICVRYLIACAERSGLSSEWSTLTDTFGPSRMAEQVRKAIWRDKKVK